MLVYDESESSLPRIRVTISKAAQTSLMELQKKTKKPPSEVINELLIEQHRSILDDELCKKELFPSCIIYNLQMSFCFSYECECFNFFIEKRNIKLYLERVPKRHVTNRLPFITTATLIIELEEKTDFPKHKKLHEIREIIQKNTIDVAFYLLKKTIIQYRRVTKTYYNIGTIKPPMNLEEFQRNVHIMIIKNGQVYSTTKLMPVKEGSEIVVIHKLDDNIRAKITNVINHDESSTVFSIPYDFFDQSIISYYDEEWELCLIQGVIAMESAVSRLVLKSLVTPIFIQKEGSIQKLYKSYREASGLPKKITRFLFFIIGNKKLTESENKLKKIMPLISNRKTKDGLYDIRSKVVHEGLSVTNKEAKNTIDIVPQFFEIINSILS